jgi:hypothetical protein
MNSSQVCTTCGADWFEGGDYDESLLADVPVSTTAHEPAPVNGGTIPDPQQKAINLAHEVMAHIHAAQLVGGFDSYFVNKIVDEIDKSLKEAERSGWERGREAAIDNVHREINKWMLDPNDERLMQDVFESVRDMKSEVTP